MGHFSSLICHGFFATALLASGAVQAATVHPHPRAASVRPPDAGASCMDNSRYVSHVAYVPAGPAPSMQCGHLLSTDTMLTVHRWDKT